ncbi:sigma-70 family RNA polymerase sigma factor [Opitutus terrae]|uniref:RNA polymerase, sigma-24 subunit, ECF subfamily n=1 Tax=Opitutus terrae (strain DSM 11246 / JCM 15787 / PB90-1) TaxID=452637 RepID=B1ZZZ5_OPITP|nr:sigma-70 family RNA polymerase sigma factor [Opitutus terrae]ACB77331.1 RNA polymerase, sigma-24 subunit, ECF subfamily [Opitutus terrae PB90-1]
MSADVSTRGHDDFTRLWAAHRDAVRQLLTRLAPAAEIDDLLQETFVKAARALASFRGESEIGTWLHQIAHRTVLDHLRSRRHHEAQRTESLTKEDREETGASAPPEALVAQAEASSRLEQQEMHGCIREYVDRLAPSHREVIALKDLEGLTNLEIAAGLGISVAAAKIRLHRARIALRGLLAEGCEFYQSDTGTLACDRRREEPPVSPSLAIPSKEPQPDLVAGRDEPPGRNSNDQTIMSVVSSSCCSTPQPGVPAMPAAMSSCCATPSAAASGIPAAMSSCFADPRATASATPTPSLYNAVTAEFVAIGAAIGANCEPCLRHHTREAMKLGISAADIAKAVAFAATVKETPARNILKLAERLTQEGGEANATGPSASGCGCSA